MNLRGRTGNTVNPEDGETQWKRSGCGPRRVHQPPVKYSLSQAVSLALNPGSPALSRWLIQLLGLACRRWGRDALHRACELPTLWKSLLYCKNNSAFVLCVILTILANKYQVPNYKHFIWMNVFNLHRNPLNQVLFLSAFAKEEAKSETAKKLLEVIQPGSDRARIPIQIRRLESPRA